MNYGMTDTSVSNMSYKDRIQETGAIGENLMKEYMIEAGFDRVTLSENKYDMFKDIIGYWKNIRNIVEGKVRSTIMQGKYKGCVPIEANQCQKIDNADIVYVINNPMSVDEKVYIRQIMDKADYEYSRTWGSGNGVRFYQIASMKIVKEITDRKIIQRLYELNTSQYKQ